MVLRLLAALLVFSTTSFAGISDDVRAALAQKRDGHVFSLVGIGGPRKAMIQIGG